KNVLCVSVAACVCGYTQDFWISFQYHCDQVGMWTCCIFWMPGSVMSISRCSRGVCVCVCVCCLCVKYVLWTCCIFCMSGAVLCVSRCSRGVCVCVCVCVCVLPGM